MEQDKDQFKTIRFFNCGRLEKSMPVEIRN